MTSELLTKQNEILPGGEDDVRQYLHEIHQYPRLSVQEEQELARRCAEGDEEAIRTMVNSNLRLVVSVAREYMGRGAPLMDLIQEGSIGLLTAAKKFDYTLEFRFSTYATKWIRQGISRYLANHGMIRVPVHTADRIRKIAAAREDLLRQNGTEPTVEVLARHCDLPENKVRQYLRYQSDIYSLDAPAGDEDSILGHFVEDQRSPQPYEEMVRQELNQTVNALISSLTERQQQILRLHFGMDDGICLSLGEIGKMLGISKERARQIERQAIVRLQELGVSMGLEDFLE